MSLPSQSPRAAATGRTHMRTHRRRGLRVRPAVIAAFVVVAGVGATWWLTRGDHAPKKLLGPDTAAAGDQSLGDPYAPEGDPRASGQPAPGGPTDRGRPDGRGDPPVTIAQGRQDGGETGFDPGRPITIDQPRSLGESLDQAPPPETSPGQAQQPSTPPASTSGAFGRAISAAEQSLAANDPVAARTILSDALREPGVSEAQRSQVRARLTEINQDLLFSARVVAGDPMTDTYEIVSGDSLSRLPSKLGLAVDWRLLQRVNAIPDPNTIRLGQKIKLVRGPFHAVVDKSEYRLDLYAGPPEEESAWTYIRSFPVGLGEGDSTPTGSFVVKRNGKLVDPHWVNPRTGERFDKTNPANPIGERWIGIEGLGEDAVKTGYGLHGTIDPPSIGQQKSMGCVRMLAPDVELVYEMLVEGISRVRIEE